MQSVLVQSFPATNEEAKKNFCYVMCPMILGELACLSVLAVGPQYGCITPPIVLGVGLCLPTLV